MDDKLADLYYSPRGYWKGLAAIKHLVAAVRVALAQVKHSNAGKTKVSADVVHTWLKKQAIWQIYLPAPRYVPRPKFDVATPNEVHQADLYLPHDRVAKRTYKYAFTVVDVASRLKEAEPLTSKGAADVAEALSRIYKRSPLKWPKLLQVDPGRSLWARSASSWQSMASLSGAGVWIITVIRGSWSVSTELWPRSCSAISMPRRCLFIRRVKGRLNGLPGCLLVLRL